MQNTAMKLNKWNNRYGHHPIRVMIVEDHDLTRLSLKKALGQYPELDVVATAHNGKDALTKANTLYPDVILMDIMMPVYDGMSATAQIKADLPDTHVVMLTSFEDMVLDSILAGTDAYCLKSMSTESIVQVIRTVHEKVMYLHPACDKDIS